MSRAFEKCSISILKQSEKAFEILADSCKGEKKKRALADLKEISKELKLREKK